MSIPVIDLAGALQRGGPRSLQAAQALRAAAMDSGFFYVSSHGVPEEEIAAQFDVTRRFFSLPQDTKDAVALGRSRARGYERLGTQTLDAAARPDLKESFYCGMEHSPDHPYAVKGYP